MLFFFKVSLISLAFGTLPILFIDETIKLLGPFTLTNTKKKHLKFQGPQHMHMDNSDKCCHRHHHNYSTLYVREAEGFNNTELASLSMQ